MGVVWELDVLSVEKLRPETLLDGTLEHLALSCDVGDASAFGDVAETILVKIKILFDF